MEEKLEMKESNSPWVPLIILQKISQQIVKS